MSQYGSCFFPSHGPGVNTCLNVTSNVTIASLGPTGIVSGAVHPLLRHEGFDPAVGAHVRVAVDFHASRRLAYKDNVQLWDIFATMFPADGGNFVGWVGTAASLVQFGTSGSTASSPHAFDPHGQQVLRPNTASSWLRPHSYLPIACQKRGLSLPSAPALAAANRSQASCSILPSDAATAAKRSDCSLPGWVFDAEDKGSIFAGLASRNSIFADACEGWNASRRWREDDSVSTPPPPWCVGKATPVDWSLGWDDFAPLGSTFCWVLKFHVVNDYLCQHG